MKAEPDFATKSDVMLWDHVWKAKPKRPRRVRPFFQLRQSACAAACLTMICNARGVYVSVDECYGKLAKNERGFSSALGITTVAASYGLRARAYFAETHALRLLETPSILHWRENHFVVFEGWSSESGERPKASIVDPYMGRTDIDIHAFAKQYSGVAITFDGRFFPPATARAAGFLKYAAYRVFVFPILVSRRLARRTKAVLWFIRQGRC